MPLENAIWAIAQRVDNQPGFTLDINRMRRAADEGFCVAYAATQNQHGQAGLHNCVVHAQGPNGSGIIGGWYNGANNQYYFDSVRIYTTRVAAVEAARLNRQIGIYDLRRRRYVPIMTMGGSFLPSRSALRQRSLEI
jgi:hypothetical protein